MNNPDIFYVEDDTDYAFFMQNAVQEVKETLNLSIVEDGKEALEKLQAFADTKTKPKLILLSINIKSENFFLRCKMELSVEPLSATIMS